jgi:hypothetical protein
LAASLTAERLGDLAESGLQIGSGCNDRHVLRPEPDCGSNDESHGKRQSPTPWRKSRFRFLVSI